MFQVISFPGVLRGRSAALLAILLLPALAQGVEPPPTPLLENPASLGVYGDPGGAAWDGQGLLQINLLPQAQILRMGPDLSMDGGVTLPGDRPYSQASGITLVGKKVLAVARGPQQGRNQPGPWVLFGYDLPEGGFENGTLSPPLPLDDAFGEAAPVLGLPLVPPPPSSPATPGTTDGAVAPPPPAPPVPPPPLVPQAPRVEGLLVGGLGADGDGSLLLGLLSPLHEGKAVVVRLSRPGEVLSGASPAAVTKAGEVELGGEGIVSLERYDEHSWLLGSAPMDGSPQGGLWYWEDGKSPALLTRFADGRPEGVARAAAFGKVSVFLAQGGGRPARQVFVEISPPGTEVRVLSSPQRILRSPVTEGAPFHPTGVSWDEKAGVYWVASDSDGGLHAFDRVLRPVPGRTLPGASQQFQGPTGSPLLYPATVDVTESGDALTVMASHEGVLKKDRKPVVAAKKAQARGVVWVPRGEGATWGAAESPSKNLVSALVAAGIADPDQPQVEAEKAVRVGAMASTAEGEWIVGLERPLGEGGRALLLKVKGDASGSLLGETLAPLDPVVASAPGASLGPQGITGLDRLQGPWMLLTTATPEGAGQPGGTLWLWNRQDGQFRWVQRWLGYRPTGVARGADARKALVVLEKMEGGTPAARPAYDYVQVIFPPPPKPTAK